MLKVGEACKTWMGGEEQLPGEFLECKKVITYPSWTRKGALEVEQ